MNQLKKELDKRNEEIKRLKTLNASLESDLARAEIVAAVGRWKTFLQLEQQYQTMKNQMIEHTK